MRPAGLAAALVLLLAVAGGALAADELKTIPTRPGVTQSFLLVRPPGAPQASVILFPGGTGSMRLGSSAMRLGGNFLVRSRARFAAHGLLGAVVDSPSDHPRGLDGFRASAGHAADIRAVIAFLREQAPVPVWVVGTSMGTVSAANVAARLREGGADGLVLTSTVTRRAHGESVDDVRLKDITIPTLLVHHRNDACAATPYGDVVYLQDDFKKTPRHALLTFEGGTPSGDPCEAAAAHGYAGIEDTVVAAIADWILAAPRP